MNTAFLAAGGLSVIITLVHTFLGGVKIARPLLESKELGAVAKYTNYYCWHLVTIALAIMAVGFLLPGLGYLHQDSALIALLLAGGFALWGVILVPFKSLSYKLLPQGWFFVPVAALGLWGVMS